MERLAKEAIMKFTQAYATAVMGSLKPVLVSMTGMNAARIGYQIDPAKGTNCTPMETNHKTLNFPTRT